MTAIQEYDFIGKRRLDGTYDVWQAVRSGNVHFEGPLSRADAERHLLTLAKELDEVRQRQNASEGVIQCVTENGVPGCEVEAFTLSGTPQQRFDPEQQQHESPRPPPVIAVERAWRRRLGRSGRPRPRAQLTFGQQRNLLSGLRWILLQFGLLTS